MEQIHGVVENDYKRGITIADIGIIQECRDPITSLKERSGFGAAESPSQAATANLQGAELRTTSEWP
jgi:hypothetical protein